MAMRSGVTSVRHGAVRALAMLLLSTSAHAGGDDIFANGFEGCCSIGGTVSGVTASGLVLHLASDAINEDKPIDNNGSYTFTTMLAPGANYTVSITNPPSGQSCVLSNASGSMGNDGVGNVNVACGSGAGLIWDQGTWGQSWQ